MTSIAVSAGGTWSSILDQGRQTSARIEAVLAENRELRAELRAQADSIRALPEQSGAAVERALGSYSRALTDAVGLLRGALPPQPAPQQMPQQMPQLNQQQQPAPAIERIPIPIAEAVTRVRSSIAALRIGRIEELSTSSFRISIDREMFADAFRDRQEVRPILALQPLTGDQQSEIYRAVLLRYLREQAPRTEWSVTVADGYIVIRALA